MIRPFEYAKDADTVAAWLRPRGMAMVPKAELPETGFIVDGVAVAFVYMADGGLAIIDRLVTNPMSTPDERNDAVPSIFRKLKAHAFLNGAKQIVAFSDRKSTATWLKDADMRKHSDGSFYFSAGA